MIYKKPIRILLIENTGTYFCFDKLKDEMSNFKFDHPKPLSWNDCRKIAAIYMGDSSRPEAGAYSLQHKEKLILERGQLDETFDENILLLEHCDNFFSLLLTEIDSAKITAGWTALTGSDFWNAFYLRGTSFLNNLQTSNNPIIASVRGFVTEDGIHSFRIDGKLKQSLLALFDICITLTPMRRNPACYDAIGHVVHPENFITKDNTGHFCSVFDEKDLISTIKSFIEMNTHDD